MKNCIVDPRLFSTETTLKGCDLATHATRCFRVNELILLAQFETKKRVNEVEGRDDQFSMMSAAAGMIRGVLESAIQTVHYRRVRERLVVVIVVVVRRWVGS